MSKATKARLAASRRWREKNPDYNRKWQQRNRERLRPIRARYNAKLVAWYNALKDKPCTDCHEKYPYYVMQWDHVRGRKLYEPSKMVRRHVPRRRILAELKKCELVCANCHAKRTHG